MRGGSCDSYFNNLRASLKTKRLEKQNHSLLRQYTVASVEGGQAVDLERCGNKMDVELILKVAGIAMIITVVCQIMSKAGREEQSTLVSLLGMVVILILLAEKIGTLVKTLVDVFGL